MEFQKLVPKLFDYLHYKIYREAGHKLHDTPTNRKHVENFEKMLVKHYESSVGLNWLVDYFCWAFAQRESQDTKRRITIGWITGPKMFAQWLKRPSEYQWQYRDFVSKYDISIDRIKVELFEEEKEVDGLDEIEEREKKRMLGPAKLYNCLVNTTMYNHMSKICIRCEHRTLCKKMLGEKYPKLYKKRGYK